MFDKIAYKNISTNYMLALSNEKLREMRVNDFNYLVGVFAAPSYFLSGKINEFQFNESLQLLNHGTISFFNYKVDQISNIHSLSVENYLSVYIKILYLYENFANLQPKIYHSKEFISDAYNSLKVKGSKIINIIRKMQSKPYKEDAQIKFIHKLLLTRGINDANLSMSCKNINLEHSISEYLNLN